MHGSSVMCEDVAGERSILTTREVAEFFDYSLTTVWRKIKKNGLPAELRGDGESGGYLFSVDKLVAWCEERGMEMQARQLREYARSGGTRGMLPRRGAR